MAFRFERGYTRIQCVDITFETDYIVENADNMCLAVSGTLPELGSWEVAECLLARETRPGSSKWRVTATLPASQDFSWKWVVVTPDRSRVIRWEEIDNRDEQSGTKTRVIFAAWNGDAVDLPRDSSKLKKYWANT